MPEVFDGNDNEHKRNKQLLAQDLKKALSERRSRMDRMDAVDQSEEDDCSAKGTAPQFDSSTQGAITSNSGTNADTDNNNHLNNNNNCKQEDVENGRLLPQIENHHNHHHHYDDNCDHIKSMKSSRGGSVNNNNSFSSSSSISSSSKVDVVRHKPPKYPPTSTTSSPVVSNASSVVGSSLVTDSKKGVKKQYSCDDPFSTDFEDAIGDTFIEEDSELEWDHSPDTDINELSNMMSNLNSDYVEEESDVDFLPLPPPPPITMVHIGNEVDDVDNGDGEPPLPPPPLDIDLPALHSGIYTNNGDAAMYDSNENSDINQNIVLMPKPMALIPNVADKLRTGRSNDNLYTLPKIKETAIDDDLDIQLVGSSMKYGENSGVCEDNVSINSNDVVNASSRSHRHNPCGGLCESCIGLQNVVITETTIMGDSDIITNNENINDNSKMHNQLDILDEKPPKIPLDVNVITINNTSTISDDTNHLPFTLNTVVRPKSDIMNHSRPYYENVDIEVNGKSSFDSWPKTAMYEGVIVPSIHGGGSLNLDHRPMAPPQSLILRNQSKHVYDEISIETGGNIGDGSFNAINTCTIAKSPILSPKKQSPSGGGGSGGGKRVLFQLPNGHQHSDGEEEEIKVDIDKESKELHNKLDKPVFHGGLLHSSSSDAVLRSPNIINYNTNPNFSQTASVKPLVFLNTRETDPYLVSGTDVDISNVNKRKSTSSITTPPVLMDTTVKDVYRHSTLPVLLPRQSSLSKKQHSQQQQQLNQTSSSGTLGFQQQGGSSNSSSPTKKKVKKPKSNEHSAESEDSYFSDSDFEEDDYDDVYNIDDDGMSSTSDFTSYSDEVTQSCFNSNCIFIGDGKPGAKIVDHSLVNVCVKNTDMPRSPRAGNPELDSAYDVVMEIVKTEKAYVDRLHFLCRVVLLNIKVLNNVQDVHIIPPEALSRIFCNVEKIFSLHSSTVLPLIDERLSNWKFCPRLDDVMKELLPHFGLYHEFVENFNTAMTAMSLWMEKCPVFQKLIVEVEKTPECRRLKVKQHLFEVVQRVPVYYDLLRSYSSHLPDGSPERESIKDVIAALNELVNDLDRELGKTDRIKKLKGVQQRLDNTSTNIVSPLRQLVKEGKIKSISSKTGKKLDRYLFLMDDMLLICTSTGLASKHKLKFSLGVEKMQIHDSDNLVIPFTFYVQSRTRAIEFHCGTQEDKQCWVSTLQSVIDEYAKKKLLSQPVSVIQKSIPEEEIGKIAPKLEQPQGQAVCYICKAVMRKLFNCKGCGQVVCQKCCSHKIKLQYDNNKANKVCDECFVLVSNRDLIESTATFDIPCVRPSDPCIIAGYLQISFNKGNAWHKRWLTLHSTAVMYSFKNFKEPTVLGSLPLKRFSTSPTSKSDDVHKTTTFKVFNARRTYYMQADNADAMARWIDALADLIDRKA